MQKIIELLQKEAQVSLNKIKEMEKQINDKQSVKEELLEQYQIEIDHKDKCEEAINILKKQ